MEVYYYDWITNAAHPYKGFYVDINGKPKCLFSSDQPENPKHWQRAWDMVAKLKYGF